MDSTQTHPRRPPAHRSVSLVHSPRYKRARTDSSLQGPVPSAQPSESISRPSTSPSSLLPHVGKDDSGESSNAEKWFDKSNNDTQGRKASYADNDPPFFFQNSSSGDTPPDQRQPPPTFMFGRPDGPSLPLKADNIIDLETDGGRSADFRGVIDDLTIANKKLKRKLKAYQKLHDSKLKDDKLFEVRIHDMPAAKKRELEDVLQKFALSLRATTGSGSASTIYERLPPGLVANKSTDSAYVSASASGQGSSAQSNSSFKKERFMQSSKSRQQNIQTYLHDIPTGLMPRQAPVMTENGRKKLVVRLLEQLFAGKGAVGGHGQPLQQQEVSQSAARADRTASEANGHPAMMEGGREAHIMDEETEDPVISMTDSIQKLSSECHIVEQDFAQTNNHVKNLEQRPTRPLDLDPARAQIPADNLRYFRHLGFSPPDADTMSPPKDGHGWIYVNVLSNMAQVHTLNVTADFIAKAIETYSRKLELSPDGRKVRWKGGKSPTQNSSEGGITPAASASGTDDPSGRKSPRKRLKLSALDSSSTDGNQKRRAWVAKPDNKLAYIPLFYHNSSTGDDDSSSEEEDGNLTTSPPLLRPGDSSGRTSSGVRTKKAKKNDSGPIIFYNNVKFCTDLSGDSKGAEAALYKPLLYYNMSTQPVGLPPDKLTTTIPSETRGPLDQATVLPEPMDLDDNPIPENLELQFPAQSPLTRQAEKDHKMYHFEVSGLGGVCPADNFAINVRSLHARVDNVQTPATLHQEASKRYSSKIAGILKNAGIDGQKSRSALHKEVLFLEQKELPPSELPPASCFMSIEDSSIDDESDEDVVSVAPDSSDPPHPSAAPQPINIGYVSSNESEVGDDEDEEDESDDGEVDMLATAREIDPETIRAREREYDANMAERLAEEIPAGSSAATAGGGSGFASPTSGVDMEEYEMAKAAWKEARAKQPRGAELKRTRTDDSMVTRR